MMGRPDLGLRDGKDVMRVKSNLVWVQLMARKETSAAGMQRAGRDVFFPSSA